jgi:hypothetical protein
MGSQNLRKRWKRRMRVLRDHHSASQDNPSPVIYMVNQTNVQGQREIV